MNGIVGNIVGGITGNIVRKANKASGGDDLLLDGLIVWWSMDTDGGTRLDSHTNGYDLQLRPTHIDPGVIPGKIGNATPMDISSGFVIDKADAPELDLGGIESSFTIAGWVRPDAANQANQGIQGDWSSNGVYLMWSFLSAGKLLPV